jgi:hypothetical protein
MIAGAYPARHIDGSRLAGDERHARHSDLDARTTPDAREAAAERFITDWYRGCVRQRVRGGGGPASSPRFWCIEASSRFTVGTLTWTTALKSPVSGFVIAISRR